MRLFVAVPLPAAVQQAVAHPVAALKDHLPAARWVEPENLHLTLAFLGEQPEDGVEELVEALAAACRGVSRFDAEMGAAGVFPSRGAARVLWIGLVASEEPLRLLRDRVVAACREAGARPTRGSRFQPHVTVARCRGHWDGQARRRWTTALPSGLGGRFAVDGALLVASRLTTEGARYRTLSRLPLEATT
jgi:2'-5' RNA ligase